MNGSDTDTSGADGGDGTHYQSIIDAVQDGIFAIDLEGTITYVNDSLCSLLGRERSELIGSTFETTVKSVMAQPEEYDRFSDTVENIREGTQAEGVLTFEIDRDSRRVVDVHVSKRSQENGTESIVWMVRDVTERERRAEAAEQKQAVLSELYSIGGDASLTFEEKAERILAIGCEYLEVPYGFLTRIEEGVQQMVHTVGDHKLLQPEESAPLEHSYCRKTIKSDGLVAMDNAPQELSTENLAYEIFGLGCYIGTKIIVGDNLYGTFCFAGPASCDQQFTPDQREVVKLLGQWSGYELERQRFENRLRGLHRVSQQLLLAESTDEVAETAVEVAADLFDLPLTAYWEYESDADVLCPTVETDEAVEIVGETPKFERGEGLVWESFESGEIRSYEDVVEESRTYNTKTDLQAEVHVPCGTHGIITSAATGSRAFDDIDLESLRLLGALVKEATTAVKREERLVERGKALQQQNDRLEEFADVVAHDLRNPLAGATGSLEMARQTNETEFFDRVDRSLERMDELITELLDIARGSRNQTRVRPVSLESIVEEAWFYTDAPDATLSVEGQLGEVRADETRLLQLLGNLFRNSIEHGGDDVTVEVSLLSDEPGFYVANDGSEMSEDSLEAVEKLKEGDQPAAAGIGLMSVIDVVTGHDWDFSVFNTDEGVRTEIRTSENND
jgi:PAS domain S-box-containing protein